MAIQVQGTTGNIQEVDLLHSASRFSIRPMQTTGWNSFTSKSGLVTGVAANGAIFAFRNISANPIVVRRVGVGALMTTAFTAAQQVEFGLFVCRSFTVSDSGGTAIAITGNNTKHRTSLATPTSLDARIASTGALTAGTRTVDTDTLRRVFGFSGAAGTAPFNFGADNLLSHTPGDHPLVLAINEGFEIQNITAMGAAGVMNIWVSIEFAEVVAY